MRLLTRLALSHSLPVFVMVGALAVVLASLARITASLQEVHGSELGSLGREEAIHRAAWGVEVAMRHGTDACAQGASSSDVAGSIRHRLASLDAALGEPSSPRISAMIDVIDDYRRFATKVADEGACERLQSPAIQRQRERLDERLTDAWISRMVDLHSALRIKEEDARSAGASALSSGVIIAIAACIVAALLAHQAARTVTEPLAALSAMAQRLGKGNFDATAEVQGPAEVRALAHEIECMRIRLAELETLKQGFLASVSHELRTPLTKIREALALLQDGVGGGGLNERQARILHIARVACEREIRMVTTLLDLSRLSAGSPLRLQAGSSIDEVLQSAVRDEEEEAREHGVVVEVDAQGEVPPCSLDVVLAERAVANLVRNAISVSKAGQRVLVRRELAPRGDGGQRDAWVKISVIDEGPGVPEEIRSSIFAAFMTHSVANSPKRVGIGLGLALAHKIAESHGGTLELDDSSTAGGATFRLWLPLGPDTSPMKDSAALEPVAALP
jgi:two-component system, NtrC family, sensor histidine kinase GlrK